jgi:nicotinate-nucleotide adenylyltransferase
MRATGNRLIGILGGTFNPIHFGHLRMAQELADALNLDEVRFIPSANPPHKNKPQVSAEHRASMVQLAIADNPTFQLDTRELNRAGASYTIDTLISLRDELGSKVSICLMMGSDAFTKLDSWHRWDELLNYCHIILVQRPEQQPSTKTEKLSDQMTHFLSAHYTENLDDLAEKTAGYIHMQQITAQDISATKIREKLAAGSSAKYLVPEAVLAYIAQHQLYSVAK